MPPSMTAAAGTPTVVQPLRGITVREHGDDLALAFCGKYLAALGATVHLQDGDRLTAHGPWVRAYVDDGKIASPADSAQVDAVLTADPDQNVPSGVIRVLITDNGVEGPRSQWLGGELIAQANSGLAHLVGEPGRPPLQLGGHQIDYSAGLMAFTGLMIALTSQMLRAPHPTCDIQVSRLEAAAYVEWKGRVYSQAGNDFRRGELSGPVVMTCLDGYFGFYFRPTDWPAVLTVLDAPELREPPFDTQVGRVSHRVELAAALSRASAHITAEDLYERLQRVGVPAGPVLDAEALLSSPQYAHRAFFEPNVRAGYGVVQPAIPVQFNGVRPSGAVR